MVAALTHYQVMASFLDFIFPFGMQEYPQDFYFSGLREETALQSLPQGLVIPKLGRSGREIRVCYNLKSVETSKSSREWPWSIRQTAVYHSFDVETGKSFWIVVKGSELIKDRIQEATRKGSNSSPELRSFETTAQAFNSTLATHLVLCDWCDEEWRWYLKYPEERLQDATRRGLAIIDRDPTDMRMADDDVFTFKNLQLVQDFKEKTNEVAPVLEANIDSLTEMKEHYQQIFNSRDSPEDIKANCKSEFAQFEKRVSGIITHLQRQKLRTAILQTLLGDRKSFVSLFPNIRISRQIHIVGMY